VGGGSEADASAPTSSEPATPEEPNRGLPWVRYPGRETDFVVIVAGIHTSEQSGVEVARWINAILSARAKPTKLGAVILPEVLPQYGIQARRKELRVGSKIWNGSNEFREFKEGKVWRYPARHFPPPGVPLAGLKKGVLKTLGGADRLDEFGKAIPMLPQIRQVVEIIESVKPVRIVSIHGKHPPGQGIFVDPRYTLCVMDGFALEKCKFDPAKDPAYPEVNGVPKQFDSSLTKEGRDDDGLAKQLADTLAEKDSTLIAGNRLRDPAPHVHYLERLTDDGKPENEKGYSLGDWGPVDVIDSRKGAPVFTIETYQNHESWAFDGKSGEQRIDEHGQPLRDLQGRVYRMPPGFERGGVDRAQQLHGLAQAIINVILDS
jgi:hypothetical protein